MVEKAIGKEMVEEAFDFSQPLDTEIKADEHTKKTEFQVIK